MNKKGHFIKESFKQFIISTALKAIRFLVKAKPAILAVLSLMTTPFIWVGRFLVNTFIVPFYRLTYGVRKQISRVYKPARNRFMLLVTNRYSVHVAITLIALLIVGMNLQTTSVRAETFGDRSLMYQLVAKQESLIFEETQATPEELERMAVSYRQPSGFSSIARGTDTIGGFMPILDGGTISAPTIAEGAASVAPRTEIETYTVSEGDTTSTIAAKFNLSLNTVLWANNLTVRSILRPGDELTILPVSGIQHTVKSGDTLSKIAKTYSAEETDILSYNKLASADDLRVGEPLIVPGGEKPAPIPPRIVTPRITTPTPTTPTVQPQVTGSGTMVWPTDLRVITQYFGWSHTGVDIDCHYDNDNYAADDGIVQFTGWKGGYGYTVEVNHGNGIVTRYAHHAKIYVSNGAQVTKGQALGLCGTTGRSTGTHLHFEVIVNGKFRNPLEYTR